MTEAGLVIKNARIITMDGGLPRAGAVAVSGARILGVGSNADVAEFIGEKTKVIDVSGRVIVPGFNDAHCHLFSLIRKLLSLDLSPETVSGIDDIKEIIRQKVRETPRGNWISGTGFNEFYLAEKRLPNRRDIDDVAPDHPVALAHRGLHACVLNSRALALAGINAETPDPPGGVIDRDVQTGEPTGILYEMLGYIRNQVLPPLSAEELEQGIRLANRHYLASGITSIQDATVSNDFKRWELMHGFQESGLLQSRVYLMFGAPALSRFQEAGMTTGWGDEHLRLGGVKIMLSEATGQLRPVPEELNELALACHRAGFQLAIHAIQENAVAAAIGALEYVSSRDRLFGRRHRIEHGSECPPRLLERLSQLPVAVVTQPPFVYYSGERYLATVPASQQPWLYRIGSWLRAGLLVAGSSDAPVVPDNPLVGIATAVTRTAESGQQVQPQEGITPEQALALYTVNAARVYFEENEKGSVSPGKLADMVVLSDDPTTVAPGVIKDIKVEMTIIGGKVVWEA